MKMLKRIKAGEEQLKDQFINANLRLVLSMVKKFNNRGENVDELFQVGVVGLIKAMDNFDISQNVQFSTYAVPMIIGEIRRYLRDNNPIRVSRSVRDLAYKSLMVRERILKETQTEPTIIQIANELGVEKEEIAISLDAIQDPVSLQETVYGSDNDNLYVMDQISDKKNTDDKWTEDIAISEALKKLTKKEKIIMSNII